MRQARRGKKKGSGSTRRSSRGRDPTKRSTSTTSSTTDRRRWGGPGLCVPATLALKTFIVGIRGATVSGAAVVVSSSGQLGVQSSSRRYKEDIQPMGEASAALMKLKPVKFLYKEADEQGQTPVQFGLIAEEVAEVLPELVVRDDKGQPETVAYHVLPSLLLNEYQKQQKKLADDREDLRDVTAKLAEVTAREDRSSLDLERLHDALAARDKELAAMRAEMTALRQVTQQMMAMMPNATTIGMTGQ